MDNVNMTANKCVLQTIIREPSRISVSGEFHSFEPQNIELDIY